MDFGVSGCFGADLEGVSLSLRCFWEDFEKSEVFWVGFWGGSLCL